MRAIGLCSLGHIWRLYCHHGYFHSEGVGDLQRQAPEASMRLPDLGYDDAQAEMLPVSGDVPFPEPRKRKKRKDYGDSYRR